MRVATSLIRYFIGCCRFLTVTLAEATPLRETEREREKQGRMLIRCPSNAFSMRTNAPGDALLLCIVSMRRETGKSFSCSLLVVA
jgi:hypothetical protein